MNKRVVISVGKYIYAAVVIDYDNNIEEWKRNAFKIVKTFEMKYDLISFKGSLPQFKDFKRELENLLLQFEWKAGDKHPISHLNLKRFIIYDYTEKVYYDYTEFDTIKIIELLRYAQNIHNMGKNAVQMYEEKQIYYFLRINNTKGGIVIFNIKVEREEKERTIKTIQFLIENLYRKYIFKEEFSEAAKYTFSTEEYKTLIENQGKFISLGGRGPPISTGGS
ncbi:MAG: hypothetical protein ACTSYR_04540 [Candidatus Odinarchaeia archaeon]